MNTARERHTATLLPDGRVVVAGGYSLSGGYLASAEAYDPSTGAWSPTGSLNAARSEHTATLLPNGYVLVVGGYNGDYLASAELYDPVSGAWSTTGDLNTGRSEHTATLLPDGRLLVAGGWDGINTLASAEVYDRGLGFDPAWRPTLDLVNSPLLPGEPLQANGSRWRGYHFAEASDGTTSSSATNFPQVRLRRLDNEQLRWLLPDPAQPFSATSFVSQPFSDFPQGPALVTVFVNGLPSVSRITLINANPPKHEIFLPVLKR
jgi:hypothetical protein